MRLIAALLCLLPSLAAPSPAAAQGLTAMQTVDDGRGWAGVGRLDFGERAFCTGTLIEPDLVLTAAHCLFDKTTQARIDPATITFLAGWRNGRAEAYRGVSDAVVHPDFIFEGPDMLDRVAHDLALIRLDQPIRLPSVLPFPIAPRPVVGAAVGVVSYARERSEAPSLERACTVLGEQPGVMVMDCDVDFGASGSPVFTMGGGVPRVVSVISSKADAGGQPVALAAGLDAPLEELRAALSLAEGGMHRPGSLRGGQAKGAKFLRP